MPVLAAASSAAVLGGVLTTPAVETATRHLRPSVGWRQRRCAAPGRRAWPPIPDGSGCPKRAHERRTASGRSADTEEGPRLGARLNDAGWSAAEAGLALPDPARRRRRCRPGRRPGRRRLSCHVRPGRRTRRPTAPSARCTVDARRRGAGRRCRRPTAYTAPARAADRRPDHAPPAASPRSRNSPLWVPTRTTRLSHVGSLPVPPDGVEAPVEPARGAAYADLAHERLAGAEPPRSARQEGARPRQERRGVAADVRAERAGRAPTTAGVRPAAARGR